MATRVLRGDVRCAYGRDWIVLRTERGRRGEARTMVVVGTTTADGIVYERETRDLATVATWPRKGRMRVSARDRGGYYAAPWRGAFAAIDRGEG